MNPPEEVHPYYSLSEDIREDTEKLKRLFKEAKRTFYNKFKFKIPQQVFPLGSIEEKYQYLFNFMINIWKAIRELYKLEEQNIIYNYNLTGMIPNELNLYTRRSKQIKYINDIHENLINGYDEIRWGHQTEFVGHEGESEEELLSKLQKEYRRIQMRINDLK